MVMNRKDYIAEGLRQLGDEKFYQKLEEDPTMDNHSKVIDQLEAMRVRGEITQKVKTYLSVNKPRTAQLYLLPKIHKNVRPVPGRPIVSANDSATERISAFVDHFLAPIVRQSRSYLRDTSYFLNKLTAVQDTKPGDILVTLDVSSLYTNIPNLEGLNAAYDALCKYPIDELTEAFLRAEAKERSQLLRPKETPRKEDKEKDPIYLTTTYNPVYNGLSKLVRKTWDLLDRASSTRDLHYRSVRIGYRRPKNLKDILVKTKLTTDATCSDQPRTKPDLACKARNCRYCRKLEKGGKITSKTTGSKYYAKTNVTCNSNNVVYCISCIRCGKQYVGQTKNSLKQRFQSHFYYIAHDAEKTEVSRHFNRDGHKGLDDVSIRVLEFIHHGPQSEGAVDTRLSKEFDWIHRIRSQIPLGMNAIDSAY